MSGCIPGCKKRLIVSVIPKTFNPASRQLITAYSIHILSAEAALANARRRFIGGALVEGPSLKASLPCERH